MAEVYTLVGIAYDRFRVMIDLNQDAHTKSSRAIKGIVVVWVLAIVYSMRAPFLFESHEHHFDLGNGERSSVTQCGPLQDAKGTLVAELFIIVDFVVLFIVPAVIIVVLYIIIVQRSKRASNLNIQDTSRRMRVFKTASVLVGLFVICSLPHYALEFYVYLGPGPFNGEGVLTNIFELIAFVNFGLNPILYALMRKNFRDALRRKFGVKNSIAPGLSGSSETGRIKNLKTGTTKVSPPSSC